MGCEDNEEGWEEDEISPTYIPHDVPQSDDEVSDEELTDDEQVESVISILVQAVSLVEAHNGQNNPVGDEPIVSVVLSQKFMGECSEIGELAQTWIFTHQSSRLEAIRAMLELMLHSTGYIVPLSHIQALKLIDLTVETFDERIMDPNLKPPMLNGLYLKNLAKFIKLTLVDGVGLDDTIIMKRIKHLLMVVIHSGRPSVRYCGLMISYFVTGQYIAYWSRLDAELRDDSVTGDKTELRETMISVESFFAVFMNFVLISLRDRHLTVRKEAFKIFFNFCLKEKLLMTDYYLSHVVLGMFDDSSSIRCMAIMSCWSLYQIKYVVEKVESFVKKSLPFVIREVWDEDNNVAEAALKAVVGVYRFASKFLKDVDLQAVFELVLGDRSDNITEEASKFFHKVMADSSSTNLVYIDRTVLFLKKSLDEFDKDSDIGVVVHIFVRSLFLHFHQVLTDWASWKLYLQSSCLKEKVEQEVACSLLCEVMEHLSVYTGDRSFFQMEFPPIPENCDVQETNPPVVDLGWKNKCLNYLKQMTSQLGPELLGLWEKYKDNKNCMLILVTVPLYFNGEIDPVKMRLMCGFLFHLRNKLVDSRSMFVIHRTMACFCHLISLSKRCSNILPKFEHLIFRDVVPEFWRVCKKMTQKKLSKQENLKCVLVIKQAHSVAQFFDVTKTCLVEDAFHGLIIGKINNNELVINSSAVICLYILQWQLKNLFEGNFDSTEMLSRQQNIQSQSRRLMAELENLVVSNKSSIVICRVAYSVICRMLEILSPTNAFCGKYPLIHLPNPSALLMERLSYVMKYIIAPLKEEVPKDEALYGRALAGLHKFCSLLETGRVHSVYIASILPYFRFYLHEQNYNEVLVSSIQVLAEHSSFPQLFIDTLVSMKDNSNTEVESCVDVEVIAKAFCAVAMPQLHTVDRTQKIALEILSYGLSVMMKPTLHFVFHILTPFIELLEKGQAIRIYSLTLARFPQYVAEEEVRMFLIALNKRSALDLSEENQHNPQAPPQES